MPKWLDGAVLPRFMRRPFDMRRILFSVLFIIGLSFSSAYCEDQYSGLSLNMSHFSLNGSSAVNSVLGNEQAGKIATGRYAYGLNLITQRHGLVTSSYDLSLESGISSWQKGSKFSSRMNILHFFYSMRYTLVNQGRFSLYPVLGLGLQQTSLEIKERNLKTSSFQDVLNGRTVDATFTSLHLAIKIALQMEFEVAEHHSEGIKTKIPIGLELAYIQPVYALIDNSLSGNGYSFVKVSGLPQLAWSGLKLSMSIGLRALIRGDTAR